jgi:Ran-binding protein 9/10
VPALLLAIDQRSLSLSTIPPNHVPYLCPRSHKHPTSILDRDVPTTMGLFSSHQRLERQQPSGPWPRERRPHAQDTAPPAWKPAPETSYTLGLFNEASDDDWKSAEKFCRTHPPDPPRILASDVIDRIRLHGCAAWALEQPATPRFVGRIDRSGQNKPRTGVSSWKVCTEKRCKDTCLLSNLPLMAGLYDIRGTLGIYYEVRVNSMEGVVAIGTSLCHPTA